MATKAQPIRSEAAKGRVVLRSSTVLGKIAVAQRAFDEGEVVLEEPPLLVIAKNGLSSAAWEQGPRPEPAISFAALAVDMGLPPSFFDAIEAAVTTLSENDFQLVSDELYSPMAHQPADADAWLSDVLRPTVSEMNACTAIFEDIPRNKAIANPAHLAVLKRIFWPRTKTTSPHERAAFAALRFIHGVRVNTHSDDKAGYSAVFIAASKFTHDCCPNTFWYLRRDTEDDSAEGLRTAVRAVHVATRKINEGDMLTFSYVGTGWNMLTHTLERRLMLRALNFTCGCSRCTKFDEGAENCRGLHCPECLGNMPTPSKPGDLCLSKAATLTLQPMGGWKCTQCGSTPSSDDVNEVLGSERAMIDRVLSSFFRASGPRVAGAAPPPPTRSELKAKASMVRRVAESYSQAHYLWAAAVCGLCRAICLFFAAPPSAAAVEKTSDGAAALSLSFLTASIVGATVWFERNLKGSPQHVRFMSHVCQVRTAVAAYFAASPSGVFEDEADPNGLVALQRVASRFDSTVAKFSHYADYAAVK